MGETSRQAFSSTCSLVTALATISLALVGCSAGDPRNASAPTLSRPATASPAGHETARPDPSVATSTGCVNATDVVSAKDGVISAGPFKSNRGRWQQAQGTKFWVATSVDQKPTAAIIHAQRLNTNASPVVDRRGTDRIATTSDDPPGLFFPGPLRLAHPGTWKITVMIGSDSGCFLVRV